MKMETKIKRLPKWLVQKTPKGGAVHQLKKKLRNRGLFTVCETARCPNIGRCFAKPTATLMIMGDRCTRNCGFCSVTSGPPLPLDPDEPDKVADLAAELKLTHVVITSVTRDDLPDGGASHFAACVQKVKCALPDATIELLTPDFQGDLRILEKLLEAPFEVFNHNLETVSRLYSKIRPKAKYQRSLKLLETVKLLKPECLTKSGLMVGLGESMEEISEVFGDLASIHVDAVTVGQYMRPTLKNLPVVEYLAPEVFRRLGENAKAAGIRFVASEPLVRSSFNAEKMVEEAKKYLACEDRSKI